MRDNVGLEILRTALKWKVNVFEMKVTGIEDDDKRYRRGGWRKLKLKVNAGKGFACLWIVINKVVPLGASWTALLLQIPKERRHLWKVDNIDRLAFPLSRRLWWTHISAWYGFCRLRRGLVGAWFAGGRRWNFAEAHFRKETCSSTYKIVVDMKISERKGLERGSLLTRGKGVLKRFECVNACNICVKLW